MFFVKVFGEEYLTFPNDNGTGRLLAIEEWRGFTTHVWYFGFHALVVEEPPFSMAQSIY